MGVHHHEASFVPEKKKVKTCGDIGWKLFDDSGNTVPCHHDDHDMLLNTGVTASFPCDMDMWKAVSGGTETRNDGIEFAAMQMF